MGWGFSEAELVSRLVGLLARRWRCPSLGPGDDAACVSPRHPGLLLKVDGGSVEQNLAPWMSPRDLGWLMVAEAASDLAAKAAAPLAFAVSVGVPRGWGAGDVVELVEGAAEAAEAHGAWLSGGDTNASPGGGGWVDVAAVGAALPMWGPLPRGGGPGMLVYTTVGRYGLMGMLWHSLYTGSWRRLVEREGEAVREASRPVARLGFARLAARLPRGCLGGSVDVSDGLARSLHLLAEAAGARLLLERLPSPHPASERYAAETGAGLENLILYGGQELEIVFTVDPACEEEMLRAAALEGLQVERIGRLGEGGPGVYYRGRSLEPRGWDNLQPPHGGPGG